METKEKNNGKTILLILLITILLGAAAVGGYYFKTKTGCSTPKNLSSQVGKKEPTENKGMRYWLDGTKQVISTNGIQFNIPEYYSFIPEIGESGYFSAIIVANLNMVQEIGHSNVWITKKEYKNVDEEIEYNEKHIEDADLTNCNVEKIKKLGIDVMHLHGDCDVMDGDYYYGTYIFYIPNSEYYVNVSHDIPINTYDNNESFEKDIDEALKPIIDSLTWK